MAFTKLVLTSAAAVPVPPDGVEVAVRKLNVRRKGKSSGTARYAVIRIGAVIARKAGWSGDTLKASILIGDGLERNRCGICADPRGGGVHGQAQAQRQLPADPSRARGWRNAEF